VTGYPDPIRADLQRSVREYTDQVINQAWPLQQQGKVPSGGVEQMNRFQAMLTKFEPATEGQKLLHGETLRAYNQLIQARRLRLDAVGTGLPSVMWAVILIGAFISLSASFFFKVEDARLHLIEVLLLAIFIGLGLGLALPFLLLGFVPALRRLLPRPGAWMDLFRHIFAVPMLVTALGLAWILGRQAGVDGMTIGLAAALLVGCVSTVLIKVLVQFGVIS